MILQLNSRSSIFLLATSKTMLTRLVKKACPIQSTASYIFFQVVKGSGTSGHWCCANYSRTYCFLEEYYLRIYKIVCFFFFDADRYTRKEATSCNNLSIYQLSRVAWIWQLIISSSQHFFFSIFGPRILPDIKLTVT